jgi:predicted ATPase/class 3 adenylate cyclase
MARPPVGTVTFLFTDLEGSTRLWESDPSGAGAAIARHERLLRRVVGERSGVVVKGTGDGVLAVFSSANDALAAAVAIQIEVERDATVRSRIALHTGEAEFRDGDYYGVALNRCQRVMSIGHGGQILLTLATEEVLTQPLPGGVVLVELGRHRLRDVADPMSLFQVTHPQLMSEFPPLRTSVTFAHNLPAPLTDFVGRERELIDGARAVRGSRLTTFTGIGGGGKSRLGLQVATVLVDEFPGGVWLIELASVADPSLVPRSIAQVLGIPEEPGRDLLGAVGLRLGQAPALLLLDNCEHLVESAASAVDHLLRVAPGLRVLATSRERLGVPGETVYVVPPMSVPEGDDASSAAAAMEHDAVRLFVKRAALADPGFVLTDQNSAVVSRVCRLVDGIPLAIELAAGRVGSLSVSEVAARLESHFGLLAGGSRTVDHRHQTMLAALDWSYQLLSPAEREVLAQLATFRGSFELAQVEAICHVEDPAGVLGAVVGLVDKSLLIHDPATGRYRLLEPVRRYAGDKLAESGQTQAVALNHALFFADLIEKAADAEAVDQAAHLNSLEQEHDNLRAALRWSLDAADGDLALRIGSAAWDFWKLRGHLSEGLAWLERGLEASRGAPPAVRARALRGAGDLAAGQGDTTRARRYLEQSLQLAEELGDDTAAAESLTRLAALPHREGDLVGATRLFEEALERARVAGDPSRVGHILASLALLSEDQGLSDRAERYAAEALSTRRPTDDVYVVTDALLALGEISINRGDWQAARGSLEKALQEARRAGFPDVIGWATAYLGKMALGEGQIQEGERLLSEGLAMFQRLGLPVAAAWAMRHLGRAALELGDATRADALLRGALQISLAQVRPDVPLVLQAIAELEVRRGRWDRGAVLSAAAEATRNRMGLKLPAREQAAALAALDEASAHLGGDDFHRLSAEGAAMTIEQAGARAAEQ